MVSIIARITGTKTITVLTLFKKAELIATVMLVMIYNKRRFPLLALTTFTARNWKKPDFSINGMIIIIPRSNDKVLKSTKVLRCSRSKFGIRLKILFREIKMAPAANPEAALFIFPVMRL